MAFFCTAYAVRTVRPHCDLTGQPIIACAKGELSTHTTLLWRLVSCVQQEIKTEQNKVWNETH